MDTTAPEQIFQIPRLLLEIDTHGHETVTRLILGIPGYTDYHVERSFPTEHLTSAGWESVIYCLLGSIREQLETTVRLARDGRVERVRGNSFTDAEIQEAERLLNDDALWRDRGMPERDAFIERMRNDHGLDVVFQTITPENTSRWIVFRSVPENLAPETFAQIRDTLRNGNPPVALEPERAIQEIRQFGTVTGVVAAGAAVEGLQNWRPITEAGERAARGNDLPEETI